MIKTLNPCNNNPAKTAEIMSRYRPIAPKPETPSNSTSEGSSSSSLSPKIKQSPYLRNLWPQLQARPTRTRKRGRALPSFKRHKPHLLGFCPPTCHITTPPPPPPTKLNFSLQSFSPVLPQLLPLPKPNHRVLNLTLENTPTTTPSLVTLPLLPCSPSPNPGTREEEVIIVDLNTAKTEIPEEKDLLKQFQGQNVSNIIAPQPVRPVGSCINVGCINEDPTLPQISHAPKRPEQVEEEVECEPLPAVISDSNNRVRMANSAYREMVGQPQCSWLESMVTGLPRGACTRISGEVALHLCDSRVPISSSNGFSCWVRIEWNNSDDGKRNSVNAFCDVIRLSCESRDYLFTWRFHIRPTEVSQSS